MTYMNTKRAGRPWTRTETTRLMRAYPANTYADIAASKFFKGNRSIKALRRRFERVEFGY